jgi:hypothetical protein
MSKKRNYREIFPLTKEEIKKLVGHLQKNRKGCWLWKSDGYSGGYGRITLRGRVWMAHRIAYEFFVGRIRKGYVVDHLCRVPACCNPDHLEAVTNSTNTLRGAIPRGDRHYKRKKTHCKYGHPFSGDNLTWEKSRGRLKRVCRVCRNRKARERWRLKNNSEGRAGRAR